MKKISGSISIIAAAKIPQVISGIIAANKCSQKETREALIFIKM
ncbi:MAG: hypothetical protein ACKO96_16730 [Flammeovirgaceae bacterium]